MEAAIELGKVAELLRLEQAEELRLHEAWLRQRTIQQRKEAGLTWFPLQITETGYGLGSYPFIVVEQPGKRFRHQFQSASPVALFSAAAGNEKEKLHGTIGYVDDGRMKITFRVDELPDWIDDGKLGVDLLFDSRTFDEMWKALNFFINVEKGRARELRDVLLGHRAPAWYPRTVEPSPLLNASQNDALRQMIEAEDVALVHGPPGTGKTTTLVQGIARMCADGQKVLVCAPSNAAVDHLTRSIAAAGIRVVRIGNLARVEEQTTGYTLDVLIAQDKDYKQIRELKKRAAELRRMGGKYKRSFGKEEAEQRRLIFREAKEIGREARELENHIVERTLDAAQVITCTLIGSTHEFIAERTFDAVVIDEAGQALEPACWVPIRKASRVIMAGDPFQLPPTVKSQEAERGGLSVTLLEKGIQRIERVALLRTQYRMNEAIMAFSNEWFYGGKLEAHPSVGHQALPGDERPVEFVDTAGCGYTEEEGPESESRMNKGEAALLLRHLEGLRAMYGNFQAGVIAPYRAQVDLLEEVLAGLEDVVVNTVDSFQGQERDVIYLSLTRSNDKNEIGFLRDYRRMNVAMTRARRKLVIIGDSATLGADRYYSALLEYAERIGAYRSAWEWADY